MRLAFVDYVDRFDWRTCSYTTLAMYFYYHWLWDIRSPTQRPYHLSSSLFGPFISSSVNSSSVNEGTYPSSFLLPKWYIQLLCQEGKNQQAFVFLEILERVIVIRLSKFLLFFGKYCIRKPVNDGLTFRIFIGQIKNGFYF